MPPKSPRDQRIEDEPPIGMLSNGELNTNHDPLIIVNPDDDGIGNLGEEGDLSNLDDFDHL